MRKNKSLEIQLFKDQQDNCQNCIECSVTPESLNDDNLENATIEIFSNTDVNINERDIESCHKLLDRRCSAIVGKRIIIKFVNNILYPPQYKAYTIICPS